MNNKASNANLTEDHNQEEILLGPYTYITQIPGKQVRTVLISAFNDWLNIPDEKISQINDIIQLLHNASLLIDDIEDNSDLRRGVPVAHHIYGVPHTINSANYVYFLGLEKILNLNHPQAPRIFTEQLLDLHRGQGMDIYWRDTYTCPTEEQYIEMVIKKTGGLFGLGVKLMQLFSEQELEHDLKPLLDNLGLYFQIRDDLANLYSKEYEINKSFGEDLTEGKFSFVLIHGIQNSPCNTNEIMNILRQRTTDINVKKYCVKRLEDVGSFKYTIEALSRLEIQLRKQIDEFGGNPHLSKLLTKLAEIYK